MGDMKSNELADLSIIVEGDTWGEQEQHVYKAVAEAVQADTLDAIVCMAGGWAGGSPASKDFVKNADAMWRQSVWPAAISAGLATKHLREGGICVLPGAASSSRATPGASRSSMCTRPWLRLSSLTPLTPSFAWLGAGLVAVPGARTSSRTLTPCGGSLCGYGMAKAAVHQLTKSLASEGSGLPKDCLSVALLPVTLDTPMNRKWMSKADTSTWTPLDFLSDLMLRWTKGDERPPSGSLVKLVTEDSQTRLELL